MRQGESAPPGDGGANHETQSATAHVPESLDGERLDKAMAALMPELSRTRARKVISMGGAFVGPKRCRVASRVVRSGDVLKASWRQDTPRAPEHPLEVLHEDPHLAVLCKPAGQHSQGTALGDVGTLIYSAQRRFGAESRLVHRLDAPASGLMVIGRTPEATAALGEAMRSHLTDRRYLAIVAGTPPEGACTAPLRRAGRRSEVAPPEAADARTAHTDIRVLETHNGISLVEARLKTGRTHQVRVHLAHLGSPIVGDRLYGGPQGSRLCLHGWRLSLKHPESGLDLALVRPPGADFWRGAAWDPPPSLSEDDNRL